MSMRFLLVVVLISMCLTKPCENVQWKSNNRAALHFYSISWKEMVRCHVRSVRYGFCTAVLLMAARSLFHSLFIYLFAIKYIVVHLFVSKTLRRFFFFCSLCMRCGQGIQYEWYASGITNQNVKLLLCAVLYMNETFFFYHVFRFSYLVVKPIMDGMNWNVNRKWCLGI